MRSLLLGIVFACCAAAPPYRFLLVIGNQWEDDGSFLIERSGEFQVTAALLKTWGLPFDILRRDQQTMDRYHLLQRDGSPRYGTIIWDAPADSKTRDLSLLAELNQQGVSEVVPQEATVVARRGTAPFLTVFERPGRGRVAWLGVDRSIAQMQNQLVRDLLKRILVWAQGYAVYAEYDRSLILFMDDWGTSDKTYLPYWHYKTPTEEEIRHGAIEPLQKHHAVMDMNVDTGYVDRKTRRIVSPWQQRVVDEIDGKTIHDFASTKRGLDAGLAAGVFFIQSHGWTHMLPDLESPPGPFWDAPMDGVGSLDWYKIGKAS